MKQYRVKRTTRLSFYLPSPPPGFSRINALPQRAAGLFLGPISPRRQKSFNDPALFSRRSCARPVTLAMKIDPVRSHFCFRAFLASHQMIAANEDVLRRKKPCVSCAWRIERACYALVYIEEGSRVPKKCHLSLSSSSFFFLITPPRTCTRLIVYPNRKLVNEDYH